MGLAAQEWQVTGIRTQQIAKLSHKDRAAVCGVGQICNGKDTRLGGRRYSARNVVGTEALITLHEVQIPAESQQQ